MAKTKLTSSNAKAFWRSRPFKHVIKCKNLSIARRKRYYDILKRKQQRKSRYVAFKRDIYVHHATKWKWPIESCNNIQKWLKFNSWTYCKKCHLLHMSKMLPNFQQVKEPKNIKNCPCTRDVYVVPRYGDIPQELRYLKENDVFVLRPFSLHQGDYKIAANGYREKNNLTRCSWSEDSVLCKIKKLGSRKDRRRCRMAYNFLMNNAYSHYSYFIHLREQMKDINVRFNIYDYKTNKGIECALWPHLYPYLHWCESYLSSDGTRSSSLKSFMIKIKSEIVDYSLNYEILQFQYDMWLWRTVSGAVQTAISFHCSPARSLETKVFSPQFFKWHHLQLIDCVRQHGFPQLFLTISPYEWTYPYPYFLSKAMEREAKGATEMAVLESLHIGHSLEQIVRGLITGKNTNRWRKHILHPLLGKNNIQNYFYRLEFQKRGTCHIHVLIWCDLSNTNVHSLRGDIHWDKEQNAFLLYDLQRSNTNSLPLRSNDTKVKKVNNVPTLKICHPQFEYANNIRGYISEISSSLKCRMDVQATDNRNMILRYVTSYVSKVHDAQLQKSTFTRNPSTYMIAYQHLKALCPNVPEMVLQMSDIKVAWSSTNTKKFVPPSRANLANNQIISNYMGRPNDETELNFISWARTHVMEHKDGCKHQKTASLVAVRFNSIYHEEFFLQDLLVFYPFRIVQDLLHVHDETLPLEIRYFASSVEKCPQRWRDRDSIIERLQLECNKDVYIERVVLYIEHLMNMYNTWRFGRLPANVENITVEFPALKGEQVVCERIFMKMVNERSEHYESNECFLDDSLLKGWQKFLLIEGKPGTGKTHLVSNLVRKCISQDMCIHVATPTGMLSSIYSNNFGGDITCDTVHSTFRIPVEENASPSFNETLSFRDVLIIDELSMIPLNMFNHIVYSVNLCHIRPLVVLVGDKMQQQPITTVNGKTITCPNAFSCENIRKLCKYFTLFTQHRIIDEEFSNIVDVIRFSKPSQRVLNDLCGDRVICCGNVIDETSLSSFYVANNDVTFLTLSKRGSSEINNIIMNHLFENHNEIASVYMESDISTPLNLYVGLRVMVTRNQNKRLGVVNGQVGVITHLRGTSIELKLVTGNFIYVYPLTVVEDGVKVTAYPIAPCYAHTICKSQGKTLPKVAIYFDSNRVPEGSGYVAITRVKRKCDLFFVTAPKVKHFIPVGN